MTEIELAERCEAASGPDRELDFAIIKAVGWSETRPYSREDDGWREPVCFTASIDAAMQLVPEDLAYELHKLFTKPYVAQLYDGMTCVGKGEAKTAALAMTAACLRARTNKGGGDARG